MAKSAANRKSLKQLEAEVAQHLRNVESSKPLKKEPAPITECITKKEPRTCVCGITFESSILIMDGKVVCSTKICPSCIELRNEMERSEQPQIEVHNRWHDICPPAYRDTDVSKISLKPDVRSTVLNWEYSAQGLGLIGPTRTWKTRLMFRLIERLFHEGRKCTYVNAVIFADELASLYSDSPKLAMRWVDQLCRVPVFFLDDIGKERMTDRVESAYYRIFEYRGSHLLPIYFTSNSNREALKKKMTIDGQMSDRAEPIVERLAEFCQIFSVSKR